MTDMKSASELVNRGELAALEQRGLPSLYRPPTSELSIHRARQGYYEQADTGLTYSELVGEYNQHEKKRKSNSRQGNDEPIEQSRAIISTANLPGDALAEYRQRHGLDRLREQLVRELVKAASFQEGILFLAEHIKNKHQIGAEVLAGRDLSAQEIVERLYPDLTADEVSWIALLDDLSRANYTWIGDLPHHQFLPASLVGMDPRGLRFANNSESIEDHSRVVPLSPEELAGVTGHDSGTFHYPFRHNVAEGIKALIALSLNEADIFSKIREGESSVSLIRGDSALIKTFVVRHAEKFGIAPSELHRKVSDLIADRNNLLQRKDLIGIRGEVFEYLSRCCFYDTQGWRQSAIDIIKVFGLGERLPAFVHKNEPFNGSIAFYAGTLQFIDLSGRTVDSIPLAEHLKHKFGYKLIDEVDDINMRAKPSRQIFSEIDDRIRETNLTEGNQTGLDRLQERILVKYKIIVPTHSVWQLDTISNAADFYASRSANTERCSRFLKFGYEELTRLDGILHELPPIFTRAVSTLRKGSSEFRSEDILRSGTIVQGSYTPETQAVFVNVPEVGPQVNINFLAKLMEFVKDAPASRKLLQDFLASEDTLRKLEHDYFHTIVHELAESVVATLGPMLIQSWSLIDQNASRDEKMRARNMYLSRYATTDTKEDFCECCAVYVLAGDSFRALAEKSRVLGQKYAFMRQLFSHDGTQREFPDRYSHNLYDVTGDPDLPWEDVERTHFAVQFEKREQAREQAVRDTFADAVVSFEDVEDVILSHESSGHEISRNDAAEIALRQQREQSDADDDKNYCHRVFLYVFEKVAEVTEKLGASPSSAEVNIWEVLDAVYDGDSTILTELVKTNSEMPISRKTAAAMIKQLQPLVKDNNQAIDQWRALCNATDDETETNLVNVCRALVESFDRGKKLGR